MADLRHIRDWYHHNSDVRKNLSKSSRACPAYSGSPIW